MKIFRIGILLILTGVFASCSKNEEGIPDFVGESVGNYSYAVRVFRAGNTTPDIIMGDLTLSRDGDNIVMTVDDIESFVSSRLEPSSNGYGFDIEIATVTDNDGNKVDRKGDTSETINGKSYHGRYDNRTKQLFFSASYTYQKPQYASYNFSAEVTATKK